MIVLLSSNPKSTFNMLSISACLFFTGAHSLQIQTKLIKLLSSCFPEIDLCVTSFFQFKDPIPKFLISLSVNATECCILGKHTTYTWGILFLTGKKVSHLSCSSILTHLTKTSHSISFLLATHPLNYLPEKVS